MLLAMTFVLIIVSIPIGLGIMLINYFIDGYLIECPKIKFNNIKNFYSVNPRRWGLQSDYVICYTYGYGRDDINLRFGFIDYYRYKLWHKNIIKHKNEQENSKKMAEVIALVKDDIANAERTVAKQQKYQYDLLQEILRGVRNG